MEVAVLGLGEAGARIAADLAAAGCVVRGWDPARRPEGIANADSDRSAVEGADVVLSLNAGSVALDVARGVAAVLAGDTLYVDFNTASPRLKQELAAAVPVAFVDAAFVGIVPTTGLRTPALASGAGAERFAGLFRPLGMPVEVVGERPGDAAGLKLLRSVFMKGLAAAAIESLAAARAAGVEQLVHADIATVIGEPLLERLVSGSEAHAGRRADEMRAAAALVEELGVSPRVACAAAGWLEQLRDSEGAAAGSAWEWPDELDAIVAAPESHRLVFESDDVRVLDTHIAPGEVTPVHTHRWPAVFYILSGGHIVRRDADGELLEDTRTTQRVPEPGAIFEVPALPPHTVENVDATEIRFLNIERKR